VQFELFYLVTCELNGEMNATETDENGTESGGKSVKKVCLYINITAQLILTGQVEFVLTVSCCLHM